MCSFFTKLLRCDTLQDFFVVGSFTADSSLLQPTGCVNSTPRVTFSRTKTRTCVAQVESLACTHHITCVIFMRSCCVFDSLRLLHFPLFAVFLLSHRPVFLLAINFIFHDVVDKFLCTSANEDLDTLAEYDPVPDCRKCCKTKVKYSISRPASTKFGILWLGTQAI